MSPDAGRVDAPAVGVVQHSVTTTEDALAAAAMASALRFLSSSSRRCGGARASGTAYTGGRITSGQRSPFPSAEKGAARDAEAGGVRQAGSLMGCGAGSWIGSRKGRRGAGWLFWKERAPRGINGRLDDTDDATREGSAGGKGRRRDDAEC